MTYRASANFLNFRWLLATHPFPTLVATSVGSIMTYRLVGLTQIWLVLSVNYLAAQAFTGLVNDYLDFEQDAIYQPDKATSQEIISKKDLIVGLIMSGSIFVLTLLFIPVSGIVLLVLGLLIANSYNFGLKDTPISVMAFGLGFAFMFVVPYTLEFGLSLENLPVVFLISGALLSVVIHIVNTIKDFSQDRKRGSKSFVQTLGEQWSYLTMLIICAFYLLLHTESLTIFISFLPAPIMVVWASPFSPWRLNWKYQFFSLTGIFLLQIVLLPLS